MLFLFLYHLWYGFDQITPFKLGKGNSMAPGFFSGQATLYMAYCHSNALIKQRPKSHAPPGRAELHSGLLSIPSGCEWERKCGVTVCVRMITFPFRVPLGIWNRLRYSEAVNASDHAQRGGDHPKGSGLPDFRVRHRISRRHWMGNLGSSWRKRAFLYSSLFTRESLPSPLPASPPPRGRWDSCIANN